MMNSAQSKAVKTHRDRQRKRGILRVEVQVPEGDASLIRDVAAALRDEPERADRVRQRLLETLGREAGASLRESLACELPDDVMEEALERPRDFGRDLGP